LLRNWSTTSTPLPRQMSEIHIHHISVCYLCVKTRHQPCSHRSPAHFTPAHFTPGYPALPPPSAAASQQCLREPATLRAGLPCNVYGTDRPILHAHPPPHAPPRTAKHHRRRKRCVPGHRRRILSNALWRLLYRTHYLLVNRSLFSKLHTK
jgi:hypothetical protein